MNNWRTFVFKDIARFIDYRGKTPTKTQTGIPLITAKNVRYGYLSNEPREYIAEKDYKSWMTRGIPENGDIVFTTEAPLGNVAELETNEKIALAQRIVTFHPINNQYYSKFLKYYLLSPIFQQELWSRATGTTVKGIKTAILKQFLIPLPELSEQHRLAAKLDSLFALIDRTVTLVEQNSTNAQHLMASVLNDVFTVGVCDNEQVPLMKYVEFVGGSQPPKQFFSQENKDGYARLIQIRDYKSDNYKVYIKSSSTKKFCDESDVMIGRYGPPVFQILRGINGAYNVALMKAKPDEEHISKNFLFWFLQNPNIQNYIISISQRSAGQSGVNKTALEKYTIPLPSLDVQNIISDNLSKIFQRQSLMKNKQQQRLLNLSQLKASLLDSAFKGEL